MTRLKRRAEKLWPSHGSKRFGQAIEEHRTKATEAFGLFCAFKPHQPRCLAKPQDERVGRAPRTKPAFLPASEEDGPKLRTRPRIGHERAHTHRPVDFMRREAEQIDMRLTHR